MKNLPYVLPRGHRMYDRTRSRTKKKKLLPSYLE